jgi:hypothetical protein
MVVALPRHPYTTAASSLAGRILAGTPKSRLGNLIHRAAWHLPDELAAELLDALASVCLIESSLGLKHVHGPNGDRPGRIDDYGIVSRKVITDVGAAAVVNGFRNTFELELFNFHGLGTGGAAEAVGNTALTTELTTQYSVDNTRPTGVQSAPTAVGGGTLWDRSLFTALALNSGDAIIATYIATISAGG